MAKSGFDPKQSVNLWQNMDKASGDNRQAEMLSTHPAPQSRIEKLGENMGPALALYQQAQDRPQCKK